jgi:hypothetical protein
VLVIVLAEDTRFVDEVDKEAYEGLRLIVVVFGLRSCASLFLLLVERLIDWNSAVKNPPTVWFVLRLFDQDNRLVSAWLIRRLNAFFAQ